jgi:diguanylate cyclase (GGDEF)-like protein/PAS domain S-box-containing protein
VTLDIARRNRPWVANDPADAVAWDGPEAGDATGGALGDIAVPAVLVPGGSRTTEVDELFRRDGSLRCVVVETADGPVLVDRTAFEAALTGRLGYGRLLHSRRAVVEMVTEETLVMSHDAPIAAAGAAVLARRSPGTVANAMVVRMPDGGLGVAHVSTIFERLAHDYAFQSLHDPLTHLPNRLYLMEQFHQSADGDWSGVLFIDLDRFKDVNDELGHGAGDEVLAQFAERLRSSCRSRDIVARLGGDEFAVLTAAPLSPTQTLALAERLVLEAAAPFTVAVTDSSGVVAEHLVTIGASVGVAHADRSQPHGRVSSLDVLLKHADIAMYRAKEHGRGRASNYDPTLGAGRETTTTQGRRQLERKLREAIATRALSLHYQPLVQLPSGRISGVEALARWHDPELGNVTPDRFIPLAEETGLIIDLGAWVLSTACLQGARWAGGAAHDLSVAVNVSPVQLAQPGFFDVVVDALTRAGLPAHRLCLEITETAQIVDVADTVRVLGELRQLGVQVALDDFGTGHSSLTMLRSLPLDVVKIDRSFVEGVARSSQDAVLVRLVIDTAHTLGLQVCAEGVETADQASQLLSMGCDSAQGWYFGMPEPASERLTRSLAAPPAVTLVDPSLPPPVPLGAADELVVVTSGDRTITYISSTCTAILGWRPQDLLGTSVVDYLHPDTLARIDRGEAIPALHTDGRSTHQVRHSDGTFRWLDTRAQSLRDDAGAVIEVLFFSRDVTLTVQTQDALADAETKFRHAFDDSPTGMALTGLDGRLLRVNDALAAMLGRRPHDLIARTAADLTHPDDRPAQAADLDLLRTGRATTHDVTRRYLHLDGTAVPAHVTIAVINDRHAQPSYLISHIIEVP